MLIECLVKEIVLYNDRIEIYYNTPIRTSPDDNRGSHFLTESKVMCLNKDKTSLLHKTKLQIEMYLA